MPRGLHGFADVAKLKGKKIGISGVGSINQYALGLALAKVGLDAARDRDAAPVVGTVIELSAWMVTLIVSQWPASASSIELSTTS